MIKFAATLVVMLIAIAGVTACTGSDYSGHSDFWKRHGSPSQ